MQFTTKRLATAIVLLGATQFATADHMEEVIVSDSRADHSTASLDISNTVSADAAQLLRQAPGANINSIGALSGIAQYRGLSGERVAVQLDGAPVFSGGPNAMDAPLSYAPALLLKNLSVTRGIVPVSSAQGSLGGHISAQLDRGEFGDNEQFQGQGRLGSGYRSANNGTGTALLGSVANQHHKVSLLASRDQGNNREFPGGTLAGTQFERTRYDLSYGYHRDGTSALLYTGRNSTDDAGTPALPMDISFIDTDLAGFDLSTKLGDWQLSSFASYSKVDHGMDNFSQRQAPAPAVMLRNIDVRADHLAFGFSGATPLATGTLKLGCDASRSTRDSDIFNPGNSAFLIRNFNDIQRNIDGLFAEWNGKLVGWSLQAGARYNRVEASADTVAGVAVPPPVLTLAQGFNGADRNLPFNYLDLVVKADYSLSDNAQLNLGLGRNTARPLTRSCSCGRHCQSPVVWRMVAVISAIWSCGKSGPTK